MVVEGTMEEEVVAVVVTMAATVAAVAEGTATAVVAGGSPAPATGPAPAAGTTVSRVVTPATGVAPPKTGQEEGLLVAEGPTEAVAEVAAGAGVSAEKVTGTAPAGTTTLGGGIAAISAEHLKQTLSVAAVAVAVDMVAATAPGIKEGMAAVAVEAVAAATAVVAVVMTTAGAIAVGVLVRTGAGSMVGAVGIGIREGEMIAGDATTTDTDPNPEMRPPLCPARPCPSLFVTSY